MPTYRFGAAEILPKMPLHNSNKVTASRQQGGNHSTASSGTPFPPHASRDTSTSPHRVRARLLRPTTIDPGVHRTPKRPALGAGRVLRPERAVRPLRSRRQPHHLLHAWPTEDGKLATRFFSRGTRPRWARSSRASACNGAVDGRGFVGTGAVGFYPAGGVSWSL